MKIIKENEEDISEFVRDPMERLDQESVEETKGTDTQRKSRKLPEHWTRVISLSTDNLNNLKIFPISTDLLVE